MDVASAIQLQRWPLGLAWIQYFPADLTEFNVSMELMLLYNEKGKLINTAREVFQLPS